MRTILIVVVIAMLAWLAMGCPAQQVDQIVKAHKAQIEEVMQ
jgi:hypothetical protein